jgi:hypothetical protein
MDNKIFINKGIIDYRFYNEFIKYHLPKNIKNIIKEMWLKLEDEEKHIEFFSISLKSELQCCYNQLLFLDCCLDEYNLYYVVYIRNINTSSAYALASCYIYDEEDEEDNNYLTIDEVLELVCKYNNKDEINKLLQENYTN